MKTRTAVRTAMVTLMVSLSAAGPLLAQSPSGYVTPGMEKTFVSVREVDSDGNPLGELGSGWLNLGEQVPINRRTGSIVIKYQQASSNKGYQTDPQDRSSGRVITVP